MRAYSICLQTCLTIKKRRINESWRPNTCLGVNAIDSASSATGIQWDYRKNLMVGQAQDHKFQPITNKFQMMANNQKTSNPDSEKQVSILENLALAKEHLVCIWSTVDPTVKDCHEVISSTDVEKPVASVIYKMVKLTCQTIQNYGIHSIANVVDAHSSNWKALLADSTKSATDYLPADLVEKYPIIEFKFKFIMADPVTKDPIVNCPDPMHLTKNVVFALEKSWSSKHKRNIMFKKCPMHIGLAKDCWIAMGGGTNQLQSTSLTMYHFIKDNNSRMICSLSLQILSASVARMMQAAVDDDSVQVGNIRNKKILIPIIKFIIKWNRLIDIMNGRDGVYYTPENGRSVQEEMLDFLTWFTMWSNDHDKRVEAGARTEWIFFGK